MSHIKVLMCVESVNALSSCAGVYGCGKAGCLPCCAAACWVLRLFQIRTCSSSLPLQEC